MTTHPATSSGLSQCAMILSILKASRGQWVAMPDLWKVSGAFAVHSRIADLRKLGHDISHRNERTPGNKVLSYYRLEAE